MKKILFVCLGNICRSPMAKYIFQNLINQEGLDSEFYIDSAATSYEEVGNGIYPEARKKLMEKGTICEGHVAKRMSSQNYKEFDYIIGMEERNVRNILSIVGEDTEKKVFCLLDFTNDPGDISDPWYTRDFEKAYQDIYKGCKALLEYVKMHS